MKTNPALIEPLESRIAPAMVTLHIVNAHTATYTDVDGDHVTVKVSTGTLTTGLFTGVAAAHGDQLQLLDLSGGGFDKSNLRFSVEKVRGGDGLANVGYINSTGHALGAVSVIGDLGQIDAGSDSLTVPAVKSLAVRSMGRVGTDSQAPGTPSLESNILGAMGSLWVAGDVKEAIINVDGIFDDGFAPLGPVTIGGSLIGGLNEFSGSIYSRGQMGAVKIGHDVRGGAGALSGTILCDRTVLNVSISGSLVGGSGEGSGQVGALQLGLVRIGRDIQGGSIVVAGASGLDELGLAGVRIGGSLINGTISSPGQIDGTVVVANDVQDSTISTSAKILDVGGSFIRSSTNSDTGIDGARVKIGGEMVDSSIGSISFTLGSVSVCGSMVRSSISAAKIGSVKIGYDFLDGFIRSELGDTGPVTIGHDMHGGDITTSGRLGDVTIRGSFIGIVSGESRGSISSDEGMGTVTIGHDIIDAQISTRSGGMGDVTVGGSLIRAGIDSFDGDLGAVKIGHDVRGGSVSSSGAIRGVTIGGSLIEGGISTEGGFGSIGMVKIGHDMHGGSISSSAEIRGVTIGGSLIGDEMDGGSIFSSGDMGAVKIGRDIIGASITGTDSLAVSASISSLGRISSVTVGGSIISGIDDSTGSLTNNATIRAGDDIGSFSVAGSILGNETSPVIISAVGATTNLAIGKITVGGRVEFANILAGYGTSGFPPFTFSAVNGDAQIGAVSVRGDWMAGNLVAGTKNLGADDLVGGTGANADNVNYGNSHDASIGTGAANILSKIASITIGGQLFGTPTSLSATDHFGFVAEQIGAIKIGGKVIPLTPNAHNDNLALGQTNDVTLHEA